MLHIKGRLEAAKSCGRENGRIQGKTEGAEE